MGDVPIEKSRLYSVACELSDDVYDHVRQWPRLAQDTIGAQLVRAVDSVAANLVEGDGRATDVDAARFFTYARASAREASHWLSRAVARGLLSNEAATPLLEASDECGRMIHGLTKYRLNRSRANSIREDLAPYDAYAP